VHGSVFKLLANSPLLGIAWGILFLGESLTLSVLLGGTMAVASPLPVLRAARFGRPAAAPKY
jgi:drug/metabolite transporter (DMT)-like permease